MENKKKTGKTFRAATACSVIGIVGVLMFAGLIGEEKTFSDQENRTLQTSPDITVAGVLDGSYETAYENYQNDQFPFRNQWIYLKSMVEKMLGKTEANGVFLGTDDYLLENFQKQPEADYAKTVEALRNFSKANENLQQYFLLVPNAVNIYADRLPAGAPVGDQDQAMDSFAADLAQTSIQNVDIREIFRENTDMQLYYRTDHHWTTQAARLAFDPLAKSMGLEPEKTAFERIPVSDDFVGTLAAKSGFDTNQKDTIAIYTPEDGLDVVVTYVEEQKKTGTFYNKEKLDTKDQYAMFLDGNHAEIHVQTPAAQDRRLLVLKDSYANCMIPFLAPYYRKIVVMDPRYYYGNLQELIQVEEIDQILFLYNANTFFMDRSLKNIK